MTHCERVLHGKVASEHLVQLFDEPETRIEAVAQFLFHGWKLGGPLLVVARASNWALISARLEALGCTVAATVAEGRLVVLDAAITLASFLRDEPDVALFEEHVGGLVSRLGQTGRLYAYGEMVDILAEQGRLDSAHALEMLWNDLAVRESFTLLCGYASAHFGDVRDAQALHRICRSHTHVASDPTDLLATWLINDRQSHYQIA
jgi:hypothetical protein